MIKGVLLASFTVGIWIIALRILLKRVRTRHRFFFTLKLYGLSLGLYLLVQILIPTPLGSSNAPRSLDLFNGLLLHLLLFCATFEFYYTMERSINFRLLVELLEASQGTLTFDEIQSRYNLRGVLKRRMDSFVDNGYIYQRGDRYFLTKRAAFFAKIFWLGSKLYRRRTFYLNTATNRLNPIMESNNKNGSNKRR